MKTFEFILSKDKFNEYGEEVDDTVFNAIQLSDVHYLVKYNNENGWEGAEYNSSDVEDYIAEGFWIVLK